MQAEIDARPREHRLQGFGRVPSERMQEIRDRRVPKDCELLLVGVEWRLIIIAGEHYGARRAARKYRLKGRHPTRSASACARKLAHSSA